MGIERELQAYGEALWEYIVEVGCPSPPFCDVEYALKFSKDELRRMTTEELAEAAYDLGVASYSVQDEYNRQKSMEQRCKTILANEVGDLLDKDVYNHEDKWMTAARKTEQGWEVWLVLQMVRATILRLEGQSHRLNEISKILKDLSYQRR